MKQTINYLLELKENQRLLFADSEWLFSDLAAAGVRLAAPYVAREVNKDHGRIEIRQAWVITGQKILWALR